MFVMAMGVGFIVPLLPVYAETLGASGIWIGAIFGAHPFFQAFFILFLGTISDYSSKRMLMVYGLLGYCLVALGFVFAVQVHQLFILRIAQGALSAMIGPVARAYAGEIAPASKEGSVMGTVNMGFFAGFGTGPLIGGLLADWLGINAPFYAMSLLSATALILVVRFVPEQGPTLLGRMSMIQLLLQSLHMFRNDIVRGIIAIRSSVEMGRGMYASILPLFGQLTLGLSSAEVGLTVSLRAITAGLLQRYCGSLADRFNRKWLAIFGFALTPLVFLLVPQSQMLWHLLLISGLLGISMAVSVPSAEAIAVEQGRIFSMGRMMGLVQMSRSFAKGIGAVVAGWALDIFGMQNVFTFAALVSATGILLSAWFLREYPQTATSERAEHHQV